MNKISILVIEDNVTLNTNNSRILELLGYTVYSALSLSEAISILDTKEPDVILLDLGLPDGDGISFCTKIREYLSTYIIMVTGKSSKKDLIHGFQAGADDYMTKPFDMDELVIRIESGLRRKNLYNDKNRYRNLVLDPQTFSITYLEKTIKLTQKEFLLLKILVKSQGRTVPINNIYDYVWRGEHKNDSTVLWQLVCRLRRKIESISHNEMSVNSIRNEGYFLDYICPNT